MPSEEIRCVATDGKEEVMIMSLTYTKMNIHKSSIGKMNIEGSAREAVKS